MDSIKLVYFGNNKSCKQKQNLGASQSWSIYLETTDIWEVAQSLW